MASFGARIRRERQRREITLTQVSQGTKISLQYLNALERNDFRELPGGVFNRGYVRAYARFIGADPESMVRAYVAEQEARGVKDSTEDLELLRSSLAAAAQRQAQRGHSSRNRRRVRILAVAALLVATSLALAGWYYLEHHPLEEDRARGTATVGSGVSNALRDSSDAGPAAVEPEPEDSKPPVDDAASADTAVLRRVAAWLLDETDFHEQEPETPSIAADSRHLSVVRFGVGTRIVDHELQGRSDRFEEGSVVWFWTHVMGGRAGELIRHVWYHDTNEVGVSILPLGGPHWRTQSRRPLEPGSAGRWTVEVLDAQDRLLAREQFVCVPADDASTERPKKEA